MESTEQRTARIAALRAAWLAGTLDLGVAATDPGVDRLVDEVFPDAPQRRRRSRR